MSLYGCAQPLLTKAEADKGEPLTEDEVLAIRDEGSVVMLSLTDAEAIAAGRGHDDIDPEDVWGAAARAGSPGDAGDAGVRPDGRVLRGERKPAPLGLGNDHPVERVAVLPCEGACVNQVL